jgi:hypothetical protein
MLKIKSAVEMHNELCAVYDQNMSEETFKTMGQNVQKWANKCSQ